MKLERFEDIEAWQLARELAVKFETGNWEKYKDVDALPNFKFPVSSFDIGIQFDNTRFLGKSVNW